MTQRGPFARLLILQAGTLGAACGATEGDNPPLLVAGVPTTSAADPAVSPVNSGVSPTVTSVAPSTDGFIVPLDTAGTTGPQTPGDQACKLAILGDPGANPGANFAEWIEDRGPVVERYLAGPELEGFSSSRLSGYQVVLLDRLAPGAILGMAPGELATWVQGGGRVIALSGYGDYPEVVQVQNELLQPLSLGFVSETPVWGPVTQFASHPIAEGLQTLTFVGGREVTHQSSDDVIMTINDTTPVGVVAVRGSGRLFLFGDEWVTFDSEWVAMPEIEQFWVNVFDWLGGCKLTPISMIK